MSEVRLVVREADRNWSGTIHGSSADLAIAALSADPESLAELETACGRFAKPTSNWPFFTNLSPGSCDEPYDAGIVIIDLIARLVVVDSTYSSPGKSGTIQYHDGKRATDKCLRYHLADDWLFSSDHGQWSATAETRRRERAARPLLDARGVFFGRPLLEYVARETFAAFARRQPLDAPKAEANPGSSGPETDDDVTYDTLKQIHAAWLMTPREDLGGVSPRDIALQRHGHLIRDLQDQCERWSRLDECPPGLDPSSFAFRYGGFGTHELVQYYELVRRLLWSCWERLVELRESRSAADAPDSRTPGDFLTSEVPRLGKVRDEWLETPDPECHGRTPRSIIDRERARLPEGMSGHEAMIDCDCPCCQMLADMPGPTFWHLDGCNMDDDFAFDISHRTHEEWEAERRDWEEHFKRCDAERAERQRRAALGLDGGDPGEESVWSSSFFAADNPDVPLGVRLFGIGSHMAELISDIRGDGDGNGDGSSTPPQTREFIDQLNRDFGNFREVLQSSEPSVAETLIEPVFNCMAESLAAVALARPDLSAKCESLTSSLREFLDSERTESTRDFGDSESPF